MTNEWPLWEIFIRSQHGLAHKHVGSLHAPDAEHGDQECARRLHAAQRGCVDLGGALGGHRRVVAGGQGFAVRAGGEQGVPPSDVLSDAGRSEALCDG